MLQTCDVWQPITEAVLVSSEDESWLQQARFKFSDDSDSDETEPAVNQAYLQALAALKQAGQAGQPKDRHSAPAEKFPLQSQAVSNPQLAVAWPNNQLEGSQPSGIIERQHQQHCPHGFPSKKPHQLPALSPGHVPSTQSEAAAPVACVSASQDAAEQYSLHKGQSSPLSTMEVLALLFPKEQSPAAAALWLMAAQELLLLNGLSGAVPSRRTGPTICWSDWQAKQKSIQHFLP
ncbi:hypothetical protein WJX82_011410 [Trebouxia sp. C0006]